METSGSVNYLLLAAKAWLAIIASCTGWPWLIKLEYYGCHDNRALSSPAGHYPAGLGKLWLEGISLVYSVCNIKGSAWSHAIYHRCKV